MGKQSYKKGQTIHPAESFVKSAEVILSGSVRLFDAHRSITVPAGGIIGALEAPGSPCSYTYEAAEDTVLFDYAYTKESDIERIISSNPKIIPNMAGAMLRMYLDVYQNYQKLVMEAGSMFRFLKDTYADYKKLCDRFKVPPQLLSSIDELADFSPEEDVPAWEPQFFNSMRALPPELKKQFFASSVYTGLGLIMDCIRSAGRIMNLTQAAVDYLSELSSIAISGDEGSFFDLFSNLLFQVSRNPFADTTQIEAAVSRLIIYLTDSTYADTVILHKKVSDYRQSLKDIEAAILEEADMDVEKDAYEALDHSLETILSYSGITPEEMESFRDLVDHYKLLSDKNSTEDSARKLRRSIADGFYRIYEGAFFRSLTEKSIPTPVKLFFCFGYMDEELCGMNNAAILFDLIKSMEKDPSGMVMTIYDWLVKIYKGEAEPSKNEFDMDYPAHLRDQKNNGYISSADEKKLLTDVKAKVRFEIANMFSLGNRITFGRITSFCPILSEHNILRPLRSIFLTPQRVRDAIDDVRKVDYLCFYRDVLYSNPEKGVVQEYVGKEVLPHVILMPNVGSRGSLWQETAGTRRDSPGRIMLSIFPTENLNDMMLKLAGEFRWALCKKIQGVRWNDVTDPSLTAEFCDYFQFYKKNHELSGDTKEKLKLQLQRAKNNYRDAFVMDYVQWVKYESTGSPRLNKVSRGMMFRYAPFPREVLQTVASNPMYKELIEKRNIKLSQRRHNLTVLCQKIHNLGFETPPEISGELALLDR